MLGPGAGRRGQTAGREPRQDLRPGQTRAGDRLEPAAPTRALRCWGKTQAALAAMKFFYNQAVETRAARASAVAVEVGRPKCGSARKRVCGALRFSRLDWHHFRSEFAAASLKRGLTRPRPSRRQSYFRSEFAAASLKPASSRRSIPTPKRHFRSEFAAASLKLLAL